MKFTSRTAVKIKWTQFPRIYFSIQSHMRLPCIRELIFTRLKALTLENMVVVVSLQTNLISPQLRTLFIWFNSYKEKFPYLYRLTITSGYYFFNNNKLNIARWLVFIVKKFKLLFQRIVYASRGHATRILYFKANFKRIIERCGQIRIIK